MSTYYTIMSMIDGFKSFINLAVMVLTIVASRTAAGNSSPSRNACHPTLPIRQTLAETAVHTIRYFQRETLARKRRRESRLPQNITAVRPIASTAVGTRISRMRVRKVFAYASTVYSPNGRKTQAERSTRFFCGGSQG